jgi:hypothetical protein
MIHIGRNANKEQEYQTCPIEEVTDNNGNIAQNGGENVKFVVKPVVAAEGTCPGQCACNDLPYDPCGANCDPVQ